MYAQKYSSTLGMGWAPKFVWYIARCTLIWMWVRKGSKAYNCFSMNMALLTFTGNKKAIIPFTVLLYNVASVHSSHMQLT